MRHNLSLLTLTLLLMHGTAQACDGQNKKTETNQGSAHMSKEYIRDNNYRVIGSIDTDSSGKQVAYDANFRRVGEYDPKADKTRDSNFRIVGTGNQLSALVWQAHK
jgi:YD repeat-containing protein